MKVLFYYGTDDCIMIMIKPSGGLRDGRVDPPHIERKKERKPKGGLRDERCGPLAPSRGGIKVDRVCEGWPVPVEKWESAWKEGGKMY